MILICMPYIFSLHSNGKRQLIAVFFFFSFCIRRRNQSVVWVHIFVLLVLQGYKSLSPSLFQSQPNSIKTISPHFPSKSAKRPITSPHPFHDILVKALTTQLPTSLLTSLLLAHHPALHLQWLCSCNSHPSSLSVSAHCCLGRIPRAVASINQHLLNSDDVVSCCLDLGAPSMSFRINGQPVQGMFEDFNTDRFFFPVVSFSAGVK